MKFLSAILILIAIANPINAQLINGDFEEWNGNDPVGWYNLNIVYSSVEPSNDAYSGSHAAKLMIDTTWAAMWISQTIAVTSIGDEVELEVHYKGLQAGTVADLILLATPLDGIGDTLASYGDQYQAQVLRWEPLYDTYDSLMVWISLYAVDEAMTASLLLDGIVLRGVNGAAVNEHPNAGLAAKWSLDGIYPNPFNSTATVGFTLPERSQVEVSVFDLAGRQVATLTRGIFEPGFHQLAWDARNGLASGAYIIQLNSGDRRFSTRALLLR